MPNLKFALRTLFKTPFVTLVAIVSLALGIGANAAIFLDLQPDAAAAAAGRADRPAGQPLGARPKPGSTSCNTAGNCERSSASRCSAISRRSRPSSRHRRARTFGANLSYAKQTINGQGMLVSGSYFPVLGVTRRSAACSAPATIPPRRIARRRPEPRVLAAAVRRDPAC
jgi:hypothetical protein